MRILVKQFLLSIFCMVAVALATAQPHKANYNLALRFENEIEKFGNTLSPTVNYINDTDKFWYSFKTSDCTQYYIVDPELKSQRLIFDTKEILGKISEITGVAYNPNKLALYRLEFDKKQPVIIFDFKGKRFSYNYESMALLEVPKANNGAGGFGSSAYNYSPDSLYIIFVKNHNLYLKGNKKRGMDSVEIQITTDGTQYRSYAKYPGDESEILYANGTWFNNSQKFVITLVDKTNCDFMHLVDMINGPRPKLKSYKYSFPGDKEIPQYTLHLLDVKTKQIIDIPSNKWEDQYVNYAYSSNSGDRLYFYRTKRTWDQKELCLYDVESGNVKVLFNEIDMPYFDFVLAQTHFINDGREIIYRSERTGYGHFYLYDGLTGQYIKPITNGSYVTGHIEKIDTLNRDIYFRAYGREKGVNPHYNMIYKSNIDKGGLQLLTPENGDHKISLSKSYRYYVDSYSRPDSEPVTVVKNSKGKVVLELEKPDLKELYHLGWRMPETFVVKSADGVTDLYGVMWKPIDFDSTKKYPIISEVYPGPHKDYVPSSFKVSDSYATKLSQLGFIVIQVGHRGSSPLRGKYYHRQGYKNLRDYAIADDKAAITELARRYSYIDINKVGIYGHSGGGFMSTAALCYYSDFYTAAVSSAGNHDNNIYNTSWIEMNNGVKEVVSKGKDGKDSVSFKPFPIQTNIDLASNYKGHLLLVQGMLDNVVNPAHTMRMAKALMKAGKNFDMIFLPTSTHGFVSEETTFFERKMWRYFAKYLLDDPSGDYQSDLNKFYEKTK